MSLRGLRFFIATFAAAAGIALVGYTLSDRKVRELEAQVSQLEQDKERLRQYAQRLVASRRVAQITVLDKHMDEYGDPVNRILWQEIGRDGALGEPQTIEAVGELVYFEAAVVKFDHDLVGNGDAQRGSSLAFFRRVFGELQTAADAPLLRTVELASAREEAPGGGDSRINQIFWDLMENPQLASQYGVRVAQCEAPAVILRQGQVWEITLDASGGINLRIMGQRSAPPTGSLRASG